MEKRNNTLLFCALLLVLLTLPSKCTTKKILFYQGIVVGYSHQIAIAPLLDLLVEQGHQVTFFSSFNYTGSANVTTFCTDHIRSGNKAFMSEANQLATAIRTYGVKAPLFAFLIIMTGLAAEVFKDKEYTDWLKSSKFDVAIIDGAGDEIYAMANVWNARVIRYVPWAGISHWEGPLYNIPPETVSDLSLMNGFFPEPGQELGVVKRLLNYLQRLTAILIFDYWYLPTFDGLMRQHELVPVDSPPLREIVPKVTDLVMVTWDTWSHVARPLPPNVVTLAPMVVDRVLKTKPLPKDIQDFIGSDDFIYASFGTYFDPKHFPAHLTQALFEGLGALPVKVLLKWDDLEKANVPKNIMLRKFYPQVDVLAHPNIKLYFQHGGLNGFMESIILGVPSVIVPVSVDMEINSMVGVKKGFAKQLNLDSMTKEVVRDTIFEVLQNPSYKENAKKYSAISRQDDRNTRATTLNLINRILNGDDLSHLKSGNPQKPIWNRESVDVLALFFFLVYVSSAVNCWIGYHILKRLLKLVSKKGCGKFQSRTKQD